MWRHKIFSEWKEKTVCVLHIAKVLHITKCNKCEGSYGGKALEILTHGTYMEPVIHDSQGSLVIIVWVRWIFIIPNEVKGSIWLLGIVLKLWHLMIYFFLSIFRGKFQVILGGYWMFLEAFFDMLVFICCVIFY